MELDFLPKILCRTPVFAQNSDFCIKRSTLYEYIRDASPELYRSLQKGDQKNDLIDMHTQDFAVWKYFNRARFRATPFGRLAAVSLIDLCRTPNFEASKIQLYADIDPVSVLDWDDLKKFDLLNKKASHIGENLQTNATAYAVHGHQRYLHLNAGSYELCEVVQRPEVNWILEQSRHTISANELISEGSRKFNTSKKTFAELLEKLIDIQLLWSDKSTNVIGSRKAESASDVSHNCQRYFLTERKVKVADYHEPLSAEIREAVDFLNKNLPYSENLSMSDFKTAFIKKFDLRFVPLNIALDPALGIKYAGFDLQFAQHGSMINEKIFAGQYSGQSSTTIGYDPVRRFILNEMCSGQHHVDLADMIAEESIEAPRLPNSISILYRKFRDKVVLQSIGGCTANQLLGRFSLTSDAIEDFCLQIAELEQHSNPGIEFFDVSYQAEKHVDNINRRKHLYNIEFPISGYGKGRIILDGNDIFVGVRRNEVILYSRSLRKRVVPRIATAYNYRRSDLALYRFLSDLQNQSLRTNLGINIDDIVPGMKHYPRISYKNIILSPERWLIPGSLIDKLRTLGSKAAVILLREWLSNLNCSIFRAGNGDQTLIFDTGDPLDIGMLVKFLKQQKVTQAYLAEGLISERSDVIDENGHSYAAEMLLSAAHRKQIYEPIDIHPSSLAPDSICRNLSPGSEWLYYELYTHHSVSNELLINFIAPFFKTYRSYIRKWFFIRYADQGEHIRLRIHLKDRSAVSHLMISLNDLLDELLRNGKLADVQIKTYKREIERYGDCRMIILEDLFHADSEIVLSTIKHGPSLNALYASTIDFVNDLLKCAFSSQQDAVLFVQQMVEYFNREFDLNGSSFKEINKGYKLFKSSPVPIFFKKHRKHKLLMKKVQRCLAVGDRSTVADLVADVIHLRVNRLFPDQQRKHEALLYQYQLKDMKRPQDH
ncbi:hypothetical protein FPZ42_07185 [Mucilaginibacter achroorhodeus]|uniref:Thiopeptide-type bacteriocin biosynthesis protein n=1 Tax=Mucilaginibacter achroorhodeus TaxID=2599294 RepID=A0A563U673_9SPHI|nr:lantibiotic dehydratase [Mucilaginibacter achroorhodeus]TWR26814.1 hypothetical protein FPZ42_07185 [Mucilaginibacter achroorhodeus]